MHEAKRALWAVAWPVGGRLDSGCGYLSRVPLSLIVGATTRVALRAGPVEANRKRAQERSAQRKGHVAHWPHSSVEVLA